MADTQTEWMAYRARIGDYVRGRLTATPGVMRVPADGLDLFVVRDFLSPAECRALIRLIDAGREPSTLMTDPGDPDFRTSESCNLSPGHPDVIAVEDRLFRLMGLQRSHGETVQGQRYAVGQQFKPHHDFFQTDADYWPEQQATGGQRTWTAMMFLNVPHEGGETRFPQADITVVPRAGNLLTWNNLTRDGAPNLLSLHQGSPVLAGTKYIITKWYRERPWVGVPVP